MSERLYCTQNTPGDLSDCKVVKNPSGGRHSRLSLRILKSFFLWRSCRLHRSVCNNSSLCLAPCLFYLAATVWFFFQRQEDFRRSGGRFLLFSNRARRGRVRRALLGNYEDPPAGFKWRSAARGATCAGSAVPPGSRRWRRLMLNMESFLVDSCVARRRLHVVVSDTDRLCLSKFSRQWWNFFVCLCAGNYNAG